MPSNRHLRSEGKGKVSPIEAIFSYRPPALILQSVEPEVLRVHGEVVGRPPPQADAFKVSFQPPFVD